MGLGKLDGDVGNFIYRVTYSPTHSLDRSLVRLSK